MITPDINPQVRLSDAEQLDRAMAAHVAYCESCRFCAELASGMTRNGQDFTEYQRKIRESIK